VGAGVADRLAFANSANSLSWAKFEVDSDLSVDFCRFAIEPIRRVGPCSNRREGGDGEFRIRYRDKIHGVNVPICANEGAYDNRSADMATFRTFRIDRIVPGKFVSSHHTTSNARSRANCLECSRVDLGWRH